MGRVSREGLSGQAQRPRAGPHRKRTPWPRGDCVQNYDNIRGTLGALEALGSAVDEHLHLLLPALTRLIISPTQSHTAPTEMRRAAIK